VAIPHSLDRANLQNVRHSGVIVGRKAVLPVRSSCGHCVDSFLFRCDTLLWFDEFRVRWATIHANDAANALRRMESLVAEATAAPQRELIAETVNVVVFIDEDSGPAGRKVREVVVVDGYVNAKYEVTHV